MDREPCQLELVEADEVWRRIGAVPQQCLASPNPSAPDRLNLPFAVYFYF